MNSKIIVALIVGLVVGVVSCLIVLDAREEKLTMSWGFAFDLTAIDSETKKELPVTIRAESRSMADPFIEKLAIVPKEGEKIRVYGSYQNRTIFEVTSKGYSTKEIKLEGSFGRDTYTIELMKLETKDLNQAGDDNSE